MLFTLFIISQGYLLYKLVMPIENQTKSRSQELSYSSNNQINVYMKKVADPHA
ncbi:hypothetical protein [Fictibacillus barbaricus]|uniref:Uncharacterized protein n=1 Tax=Fictibacillus barbaricus TaxID=182136 RepID=A0ABS2ZBZ3_9BACL|nr:hypothetical protein [Fictibacillus barbaricus]MBN3545725.1 hypothetical protein [Fictibacillus barbaricus]GGB55592.1 hypothetical protein GCM10007199_21830 [Fictibacillus barbaricus]